MGSRCGNRLPAGTETCADLDSTIFSTVITMIPDIFPQLAPLIEARCPVSPAQRSEEPNTSMLHSNSAAKKTANSVDYNHHLSQTYTMDRALDRSLDEILAERKQVRLILPFDSFSHLFPQLWLTPNFAERQVVSWQSRQQRSSTRQIRLSSRWRQKGTCGLDPKS